MVERFDCMTLRSWLLAFPEIVYYEAFGLGVDDAFLSSDETKS
jgi:hypothetical protein